MSVRSRSRVGRCGAVSSRTARAAAWWIAALALGACASGSPAGIGAVAPPAHAGTNAARSTRPQPEPAARAADPAQDLAAAQALERDQLGIAARAAPDATTRQITALKQARELYQAFIERAKSHPEMHDALQRSRERIEDIDQTLEFLEKSATTEDSTVP